MLKLNGKPFGQWTQEDIEILLDDDDWRESDKHDYKREWKGPDDEFKKDVCSFANNVGGVIFFGIKESDGIAIELCGIENLGEDAFELVIDNSLSNCIEPIKPSFSIQVITLDNGKCILALEIKEGFNKPYCNKNDRRFFIRGNAGKVPMTYMQIEEMFLRTNSLYERVGQFLDKRVECLENQSNSLKANFQGKPYLAIYLIPVTSLLSQRKRYDLTRLPDKQSYIFQSDLFQREYDSGKMNADGFIRNYYREYNSSYNDLYQTQVQIFWNGILEAVTASIFGDELENYQKKNHLRVDSAAKAINELLDDAKRLYEVIGLEEPVIAVISLRNVSSCLIYYENADSRSSFEQSHCRSFDVLLDLSKPDIREAPNYLLDEFGYMIGQLDFYQKLLKRKKL